MVIYESATLTEYSREEGGGEGEGGEGVRPGGGAEVPHGGLAAEEDGGEEGLLLPPLDSLPAQQAAGGKVQEGQQEHVQLHRYKQTLRDSSET